MRICIEVGRGIRAKWQMERNRYATWLKLCSFPSSCPYNESCVGSKPCLNYKKSWATIKHGYIVRYQSWHCTDHSAIFNCVILVNISLIRTMRTELWVVQKVGMHQPTSRQNSAYSVLHVSAARLRQVIGSGCLASLHSGIEPISACQYCCCWHLTRLSFSIP